ncbi:hypothetical protein JHK82_038259 [Glycine max]|nr:hypothetical protein JHK82_038259 [Glycine max]KAG5132268.1 hypothetical protein JHK84_038665 [Glycine max]
MELISGLPEDVARDCLIRIPYEQFPAVASVCKGWNTEIHSPDFHRRRRTTKQAQEILVTVQSNIDSEKTRTGLLAKSTTNPVYRLSVFEPKTGSWSELPLGPELAFGLPMFCRIAGVGFDLVVPGEIRNVACVGVWEGAMLVIGSSGFGEPHVGFVLDLKSWAWTKLVSPEEYTGHVQSGCLLEI